MSEFEARIPAYYIVKRNLDDVELGEVQHFLRITPIAYVMITDMRDMDEARKLNSEAHILLLDKGENAAEWAEHLAGPTMLIGESEFIDSVYADGVREAHGKTQT